jgi:tRNA modification GTPase
VSNIRHIELLKKAYENITQAVKTLISTDISLEFIAVDIREALYYLGIIIGETTTEDLLDTIFSQFCIGK